MDQRDLVMRAKRGDQDAFATLAGAAVARLDAAARLILRDGDLARDAVQDAMVRAWRDLPGLRDPDRFDAWLRKLTVNACIDVARRRRRRSIEVELTPILMPSIADDAAGIAEREQLDDALRRLDPEWRAIVVQHFFLGMPLAEIAAAMGIPVGTVKSRLHRSLQAMRSTISDAELDVDPRGRRAVRMSSSERYERRLPTLLEELSAPRTPDYFDDILGQVGRTRQRPGWTFPERWIPMSAVSERLAAAPRAPVRAIVFVALLILARRRGHRDHRGQPAAPGPGPVRGRRQRPHRVRRRRRRDPRRQHARWRHPPWSSPAPVTIGRSSRRTARGSSTCSSALRQLDIVVAASDGTSPVVLTIDPLVSIGHLGWTPDSRSVVVGRPTGQAPRVSTWRRLHASGRLRPGQPRRFQQQPHGPFPAARRR